MVIVLVFIFIICSLAGVFQRYRISKQTSTCDLVQLRDMPFDVYVINLPGATARMNTFLKAYDTTDLSRTHGIIRYEGVVGKNIPIAEYVSTKALYEILRAERLRYRQKHYELTRGGIGCFLSHSRLWRSILDTDKDIALIFEDDCFMAQNIHQLLYHTSMPSDADMLLLGYFCNKCLPTACGVQQVKKFFGLHAYMLTRKGIQKILNNPKMKEISKQIDAVLSDMIRDGELTVYALPQPAAWQNGMPTTIQMQLRKVAGIDEWSDE